MKKELIYGLNNKWIDPDDCIGIFFDNFDYLVGKHNLYISDVEISVGLSQGFLSRVRRMKSQLNVVVANDISKFLGSNLSWMFTLHEKEIKDRRVNEDELNEGCTIAIKLSPEQARELKESLLVFNGR